MTDDVVGVGVESAALEPEIAPKIREKVFFGQISCKNSGILLIFHNPEIPGLKHRQSRDSGLRKWAGIPGLESIGANLSISGFWYQSINQLKT